jgi:hypothetical protein
MFGENIGDILFAWDVFYSNYTILDSLPEEMMPHGYVLGLFVIDWVLAEAYTAVVVIVECYCLEVELELLQ